MKKEWSVLVTLGSAVNKLRVMCFDCTCSVMRDACLFRWQLSVVNKLQVTFDCTCSVMSDAGTDRWQLKVGWINCEWHFDCPCHVMSDASLGIWQYVLPGPWMLVVAHQAMYHGNWGPRSVVQQKNATAFSWSNILEFCWWLTRRGAPLLAETLKWPENKLPVTYHTIRLSEHPY